MRSHEAADAPPTADRTPVPAARRASSVGLVLAACLATIPTLAVAAEAAPAGAAHPSVSTSPSASRAASAENRSAAGLDRYYRQRPGWGSCVTGPDDTTGRDLDRAGVQCADVTVPLDYAAPGAARSPWRYPGSGPPTPVTASARSC